LLSYCTSPNATKRYSRSSWDQLKEGQKNVVLKGFLNVSHEERNKWINEHNEMRASLSVNVGNSSSSDIGTSPARSPMTTLDDRMRMLHLLHDPHFSSVWTRAHDSLPREQLDRQPEERDDPWVVLIEAFNDYDNVKYANVLYEKDDVTGQQVVISKFQCAATGPCKDGDPCNAARYQRNISWLKTNLRTFKAEFTVIKENWDRSGKTWNTHTKSFFVFAKETMLHFMLSCYSELKE
jgi:hypothetical protein